MSVSIKINDIDYTGYLQDGFIYNETLTEELDSATIVLNGIPETDFEPFDKVEIEIEDETVYLCINSYVPTILVNGDSFDETLYSYQIQLISLTKKLERVQLPNLAITKPTGGSTKTIYKFIDRVVMPYVNRQFPELSLSSTLAALTESETCPEMSWNTPTAKQVINDLLSCIPGNPCLCKVYDDSIGYVPLSLIGDEISTDGLEDSTNYEQLSNYANAIVVDAKNVSADMRWSFTPFMTPRSNEVDITSENAIWRVPGAKFDKVIQVICRVTVDGTTRDIDISDHVVEKTIYDTLLTTSQALTGSNKSTTILSKWENYKRMHLYFTQGGNTIEGMAYTDSGVGATDTETAYQCILEYELDQAGISYSSISALKNALFSVRYYSYGDMRIKIYRNNPTTYNAHMFQTLGSQYINYTSMSKQQREYVNRLGNDIKQIAGYYDYDTIPCLGDNIGDYILAQRTVAYYDDFVIFKGTLSKNFVQLNGYIGVNARTRYSQLALEKDAITREELLETNIKLSTTDMNYDEFISEYIVPLYDENTAATQSTLMTKWINAITLTTEQGDFFLNANTYYGDRQVTITGSCVDNVSVGMATYTENSHTCQKYVKYVDSNGEVTTMTTKLWCDIATMGSPATDCESLADDYDYYMEKSRDIYKDNREALQITYQFNFVAASDDVVIGDAIGLYNTFITKANFVIKYCSSKTIDKNHPMIDSSWSTVSGHIYTDENEVIIQCSSIGTTGSWCICDSSDNIVFGCNASDGALKKVIYFGMEEI